MRHLGLRQLQPRQRVVAVQQRRRLLNEGRALRHGQGVPRLVQRFARLLAAPRRDQPRVLPLTVARKGQIDLAQQPTALGERRTHGATLLELALALAHVQVRVGLREVRDHAPRQRE